MDVSIMSSADRGIRINRGKRNRDLVVDVLLIRVNKQFKCEYLHAIEYGIDWKLRWSQ